MKHLLLTRFQGALIGANTIYITPHQIAPNQLIVDTTPALASGINSLVLHGKFDLQDWSQHILTEPIRSEQAIVAMLPLMLFFHEDRVKLRDIIINISHNWHLDWETCSSAVVVGYIISRSLTESFNSKTIVSQLLDEAINLHPSIFQELSTIDRLLDRASSLEQMRQRQQATPHPIIAATLLAIYCLLSTPEDFLLAIRRAERCEDRSQLTYTLTGILAGAHNSSTGIPLNGYLATQNRADWLLAAENLLNVWAGVYQPQGSSAEIAALPASSAPPLALPLSVASPQVIQQRR
jgi:ADP-ribosylglycohydrolase